MNININEFASLVSSKIPGTEVAEIFKDNDVKYVGIRNKMSGGGITPLVYINQCYEDYMKHGDIVVDEAVKYVKEQLEAHAVNADKAGVNTLTDWNLAKNQVICRVRKYSTSKEYLKGKVFRKMSDLAVTYHVLVPELSNGPSYQAAAPVTKGLFESWKREHEDLTEEELDRVATSNLSELTPMSIMSMSNVLRRCSLKKGADREMFLRTAEEAEEIPMYVISNDDFVQGAAAMVNTSIMDEVSSLIGDFYIIPSSVHELIVVPKDIDKDYINALVKDVNKSLNPEEVLSDHLYEYNSKTRKVKSAR